MCRLCCIVLLLTCVACSDNSDGSSGNNKPDASPAAGGGAGGKDSELRDAGDDASAYSNGGASGSAAGNSSSKGGSGGAGGAGGAVGTRPDVAPADCLPDPTDFTACGGDVVGKWRNASFCLNSGIDALRQNFSCPDITQDFNVDYRMLVQFRANGDYLADFSSDVTQNILIPKSCLGGADADCSVLGPDDTDASDDGSTLLVSDSGDNCLMDAEQHLIQNGDVGTFVTDGNMITVRDADGPDTSEYCVDGDKLTVKTVGAVSGKVTWGQFTRE